MLNATQLLSLGGKIRGAPGGSSTAAVVPPAWSWACCYPALRFSSKAFVGNGTAVWAPSAKSKRSVLVPARGVHGLRGFAKDVTPSWMEIPDLLVRLWNRQGLSTLLASRSGSKWARKCGITFLISSDTGAVRRILVSLLLGIIKWAFWRPDCHVKIIPKPSCWELGTFGCG